jgi:hypothetical protein
MKFLLWLYLANISNRIRWIGSTVFRFGLLALAIEYLLLSPHTRPVYFQHLAHVIHITWIVLIFAWLAILFPSERLILNIMTIARRDSFLRDSLVARVLRLIKYMLKHDLLKLKYTKSLYQRIVTPKRIKILYIILYCYDLYKGYRRVLGDLAYLIAGYFSFVCASWIYVYLTGASLYYYSIIDTSFAWGVAIVGFLIFKILFLPDFATIKDAIIRIIIKAVLHKMGLVKLGHSLEDKLSKYEQREGDK